MDFREMKNPCEAWVINELIEAQDENENLKEEIAVLKVQLREAKREVTHLKLELAKYAHKEVPPYDYYYYYDDQEYCDENTSPVDPFFATCDPNIDWKLFEENGIDPDTKKKAPRPKKKSTPEGEK